ncbi:MAG: hypothetical protein LBM08_08130 [Dysgonamonadaceae bacterium]|nr:hypothetical protein [Dysgonamonadaceae bacterium]
MDKKLFWEDKKLFWEDKKLFWEDKKLFWEDKKLFWEDKKLFREDKKLFWEDKKLFWEDKKLFWEDKKLIQVASIRNGCNLGSPHVLTSGICATSKQSGEAPKYFCICCMNRIRSPDKIFRGFAAPAQ